MPIDLGHERVSQWNAAIWADIEQAVLEELGRLRVAQKVFASIALPDSQTVPVDEIEANGHSIVEGQSRPFLEIGTEFSLSEAQVGDEVNLHNGRTLARAAAKSIALAEDQFFFQGQHAKPARIAPPNPAAIDGGMLAKVGHELRVDLDGRTPGEAVFDGVARGISMLVDHGHPGPFALILETTVFAEVNAPVQTSLTTTSDRLRPMLTGGLYATGALPKGIGLLASLGGEPVAIYVGNDVVTAFTQLDPAGRYRFRMFERVQMVVRDKAALVKLSVRAKKE